MPYIDPEKRKEFEWWQGNIPENVGELNYVITQILIEYLGKKKESYQTYNDIIGVLECAKLEIYRRLIVPYEEKKKNQNGDVYL